MVERQRRRRREREWVKRDKDWFFHNIINTNRESRDETFAEGLASGTHSRRWTGGNCTPLTKFYPLFDVLAPVDAVILTT